MALNIIVFCLCLNLSFQLSAILDDAHGELTEVCFFLTQWRAFCCVALVSQHVDALTDFVDDAIRRLNASAVFACD